MNQFLPFHVPDIGAEGIQSVVEAFRSRWLTSGSGSKTKRYQAEFVQRVGARHAVFANFCTAALHFALEAIGLAEGDEDIWLTMSFAATAEVVDYLKATPVLGAYCQI